MATGDALPLFASLNTDADRERKAEGSKPGTYVVVVIPDSFKHLPQYAGDRTGIYHEKTELFAAEDETGAHDPNTVLLSRFDDWEGPETTPPASPDLTSGPMNMKVCRETPVRLQPDSGLLRYFREVVWRQLVPVESEVNPSLALLDEAIPQFPPVSEISWGMKDADTEQLPLAIMAVASLSLAQGNEERRYSALQFYSQTLRELQNGMRSEELLSSDGAFLTHFLMLVYEVCHLLECC